MSSSYNSANMVTCFSEAACRAAGLPAGYNLAVPYYATNYNGWAEVETLCAPLTTLLSLK
ncbi:hypothetical protein COL5_04450 [Helicobacter pylori]